MAALSLTAFFSVIAIFAVLSLVHSWQRYGGAALSLRGQLRNCVEWRDVYVTVREVTIHPAGATILRPDFKGRERRQQAAAAFHAAA